VLEEREGHQILTLREKFLIVDDYDKKKMVNFYVHEFHFINGVFLGVFFPSPFSEKLDLIVASG
jgi:hypothetical protein